MKFPHNLHNFDKIIMFQRIRIFNIKTTYSLLNKKCYSIKLNDGRIGSAGQIGFAGYALLTVPAVTFCLGTWQVRRRKWKLELIKNLEDKTSAPPIDLPLDLDELNDMEYRKVKVRGKFDHSREIYLRPRTLNQKGKENSGGGLISTGQGGVHVITPFILADHDLTILVNRGWVPKKNTYSSSRPLGQIEDEIELVGVVRSSEQRAPFMAKNDINSPFWHYRDIEAMAEQLNTSTVFLDDAGENQIPGAPIAGQTRVSLRNEHFSYIITWYSLTAATLFLWYNKFFRKFRV
ncbi:Surfeit locus protein 1 [Chamberlinius hualienensis]